VLFYFAREAAGALGTRHSRPLSGASYMHNSGASRRGNAEAYPGNEMSANTIIHQSSQEHSWKGWIAGSSPVEPGNDEVI
jgi:hypothetical protein